MTTEQNFRSQSLAAWNQVVEQTFHGKVPELHQWVTFEAIAAVLDRIGSAANSNHMFYPTGGGMDLRGSAVSKAESATIELLTDGATLLVKPERLTFHSFGSTNHNWSYFRLECLPMKASGIYELPQGDTEELTELESGVYAPRYVRDDSSFDGEDLPESARVIVRCIRGGPFVLFAKGSTYNFTRKTYDARHAKYDLKGFEDYIRRATTGGDLE